MHKLHIICKNISNSQGTPSIICNRLNNVLSRFFLFNYIRQNINLHAYSQFTNNDSFIRLTNLRNFLTIEKNGLVANNTKDVELKSLFLIIYNKDLLSCRDIQ